MEQQYVPPTKEEFTRFINRMQQDNMQVAETLAIGLNELNQYINGEKPVPFPVWYTLVHRLTRSEITPLGWRGQVWVKMGIQ